MSLAAYKSFFRLCFVVCLAYYSIGEVYGQKWSYVDSLTRAAAAVRTDTEKIELLLTLSNAYKSGEATREFYYANEALALAHRQDWAKGKMYAEQLIGDCYIKVLAYGDAIVHFKRSISASKQLGQQQVERANLQLMAHCYHMLDSFRQAADYQKLLLDMTGQAGDLLNECYQMGAYALRLSDLGQDREAIGYMQKDIALATARFEGQQEAGLVANLLNTLATIYAKVGNTDSALNCLRTASVLVDRTDDRTLSAYIISSFCDVYTAAGQADSAILYGQQTIALGEALNNLELQQQYAQIISGLFSKQKQPAAALLYHLKSDSLLAIRNNTQKTIDQAMQVTRINMEGQAERNRLEKESLELTRKNQRAALAAALIAIAALIVLALLIYRNLREKKGANLIISEQAASLQRQNEIIDKALKEKEVLLAETHHRIKNNLQLISSLLELQVADITDEGAKSALRTAQRRIQSIATVHSKLYGSGQEESIEFSGFVSDLFERLRNAFGDKGKAVRFENSVPDAVLPLNMVVLLGLILNELITNSFKHALAHVAEPVVRIGLQKSGGAYMLQYSDNGPGLPEGKFEASSGSLGLYLVKRMSKQLKGTVSYTFDAGSRFIISFREGAN